MKKIRIITDSASDIMSMPDMPSCVQVLPMRVRFGDEEFIDGVSISHTEFYERLIESDVLPTTSLISPGEFMTAFEETIAAGEQVLAITVSSKLSGTYQSACLAAAEFGADIKVIDSLSVSIGEQVLVRYAAELIAEGRDLPYIAEALDSEKSRLHVIALLDTLDYLQKGGRVSKSVAIVGGMLAIKPVVAIRDGEIALLGTARGSKNGNNFLIKEIEKTAGIAFEKPICLGYTGLTDIMLQKYIRDSESIWTGHREALNITHIGAVIGAHAGPNAVAVAFIAHE